MRVDLAIDEDMLRRLVREYVNETLGVEARNEDIQFKAKPTIGPPWDIITGISAEVHKELT